MKLEFSRQIIKNTQIWNFYENTFRGSRVVAWGQDGRTERRKDEETDMTTLIVFFFFLQILRMRPKIVCEMVIQLTQHLQ